MFAGSWGMLWERDENRKSPQLRRCFPLSIIMMRAGTACGRVVKYSFWVICGTGERGMVKVVGGLDHFVKQPPYQESHIAR
jgi:hypothetical protein